MKIKRCFAVLLASGLVCSLSACSGGKAESKSESVVSESAVVAEPAPDVQTNSVAEEASGGNALDYASEELQAVSEERASEEVIASAYHEWFRGELDVAAQAELVYEDFVEKIGCEASWYNAWGDYRVYTWEAEGAPHVKVGATLAEVDGVWKCKYFNGNNIGAA